MQLIAIQVVTVRKQFKVEWFDHNLIETIKCKKRLSREQKQPEARIFEHNCMTQRAIRTASFEMLQQTRKISHRKFLVQLQMCIKFLLSS